MKYANYINSTSVGDGWLERNGHVLKLAQELAKKPNGFVIADLGGSTAVATRACNVLISRGLLAKVKTGHRTVRYMAPGAKPVVEPREVVVVPTPPKLDRNAPMIITPQTKFTVCPSPPADQTWHKSQFSNW